MSEARGDKALRGEPEYIDGKVFPGKDNDRTVTGKGMLIQVYDPTADPKTPPSWEHDDSSKDGQGFVPAKHEVRVIGATVKFTDV